MVVALVALLLPTAAAAIGAPKVKPEEGAVDPVVVPAAVLGVPKVNPVPVDGTTGALEPNENDDEECQFNGSRVDGRSIGGCYPKGLQGCVR